MFNNDITLAGTSTSKTYSLTSIQGAKALRFDATAPLGEPRSLTISHQEVTRSFGAADRHLVRLDETVSGTSPAPDVKISVQLVIEVPRETATFAQVQDVVDRLEAFTGTAGYLTKLLNNEP
jgi:hypothetical protein